MSGQKTLTPTMFFVKPPSRTAEEGDSGPSELETSLQRWAQREPPRRVSTTRLSKTP